MSGVSVSGSSLKDILVNKKKATGQMRNYVSLSVHLPFSLTPTTRVFALALALTLTVPRPNELEQAAATELGWADFRGAWRI